MAMQLSERTADALGRLYEHSLTNRERKKANGVYYTPPGIVDRVVANTLGKLLGKPGTSPSGKTPQDVVRLRILDPACGAGAFLLGAYRHLLDWHRAWYIANGPAQHPADIELGTDGEWRLLAAKKVGILQTNLYGVDIDANAVALARHSLVVAMSEGGPQPRPGLGSNIKCGNALIGPEFFKESHQSDERRRPLSVFDWNAEFSEIMTRGGFDVVIGNPPWGQKEIDGDPAIKQFLWTRYPSSRGIYDRFRPFVELGIRLLARGGVFGMVLPDIVLLKDYTPTRRFLLDQLSIERIDWWGRAFSSAVIDAATVIGRKQSAGKRHAVAVAVHDRKRPMRQTIPQADFWANPRHTFNLFLGADQRRLLRRLDSYPRIGDYFDVHEGVHSGNMRHELFVPRRVDESCRELYFGRGEIAPFHLSWAGRYLRLSACPECKTRQRYANLGRREWHEREKLLVRRTGDHVLAAVDRDARFASNNFFVVFAKQPFGLNLHGLCALLNCPFMTWYFQTIEPRVGRVFAELKIKHLSVFPLPHGDGNSQELRTLNRLGAKRSDVAVRLAHAAAPVEIDALRLSATELDARIASCVEVMLKLPSSVCSGFGQQRGTTKSGLDRLSTHCD
jgi:hypothetical protein